MRGFAEEIYRLYELSGADFIAQLKAVTYRAEFHPLENEPNIFTVGGETGEDYANLINAAQKAVAHGYRVYILPKLNIRSAYDPRSLAKDIQSCFEANKEAREVLIIKGNKSLSVSRHYVESKSYVKMFMKRYLR